MATLPEGVDLPPPAVQGEFRKLATDTFNAANKALKLYRGLCAFIREKQLHPYYVRQQLVELGYVKPTVSAIIRIADAPEEIYQEFSKGELGFKAALTKVRQPNEGKNGDDAAPQGGGDKPAKPLREQLRYDLLQVLENYLPVAGKPSKLQGLTVKFVANGYPCEVKIGRKKK